MVTSLAQRQVVPRWVAGEGRVAWGTLGGEQGQRTGDLRALSLQAVASLETVTEEARGAVESLYCGLQAGRWLWSSEP